MKFLPNKLALCRQLDYCCQCSKVFPITDKKKNAFSFVCFIHVYILRKKVRERGVGYKGKGEPEGPGSCSVDWGIKGRGDPKGLGSL